MATTILCLLSLMLLGPAVSTLAYSAHQPASTPPSGSSPSTDPPFRVTLPQAVAPSSLPGFIPSDNQERTMPKIANATFRDPMGFALNDGYCFFGSNKCGPLTHHGGVVMHNATIVLVLWAGCGSKGCLSCSTGYFDNSTIDPQASDPNDCTYGSLQLNYFEDFCAAGDPLLRVISQYTDRQGGLHSCSVYGNSWYYDYNAFPEVPLTDADIQKETLGVLKGMNLTANTNTAVFIFTPYGVSSCVSGGNCFPTGSYCAYHDWFWSGAPYESAQVVYASIPDAGWAGSNCGLGGPSPNHDPFADLEVSPLSHEADEMFTDPTPSYIYGDGWYYDGYLEIGDVCAYDFVGTQPADGSNVRLGSAATIGDPYRIQSEWSNANGGCTLDLKGPPTLFQETIIPDASTGTPASPQRFPIHFQEAGETGAFSMVNSTCCGVATDFYSTLGTFTTTDPVQNSTERWCFDFSCSAKDAYAAGPTFLAFYYFDLFQESTSYQVKEGGSAPAPVLSYTTAPLAAQGDNTMAGTLVLTNSSQGFWPLRGSQINVPDVLVGDAEERWATPQFLWRATAADLLPPALVYYHEYSLSFSYSVAGGGSPGNPILKFAQFGSVRETYLSNTSAPYWIDSGTRFNATDPLTGSSSSERWVTPSWSGSANGSRAVVFTYFHQYYLEEWYAIDDGGSPEAPVLRVEILGTPSTLPMNNAPLFAWVDAGSWSAPAILGNSTTERWASVGPANGSVAANYAIALVYYHQFRFVLSYSIPDGSAATAPMLTSQSFGRSMSSPLNETPATYWLDSGRPWSLNSFLNGSGALERWITNSPTNGTVSTAVTELAEYLHEYYVTIQTAQTAGGYLTPTGWYNATISLQLAASSNSGWSFERWDGSGNGAYSGGDSRPSVPILSPIVENATFYPGLVVTNTGPGEISYQWGTNSGSLSSDNTIYVPVGTNVTLRATPASLFFAFEGYGGAINTGKTITSVVVNDPTKVTTSFSLNLALLGGLFGGVALGGAALIYYMRRTKREWGYKRGSRSGRSSQPHKRLHG